MQVFPEIFFLIKKNNSNFHKNYLNKEITLVRKDMDVTDHKRLKHYIQHFSVTVSTSPAIFTEETIQSVSDLNRRK